MSIDGLKKRRSKLLALIVVLSGGLLLFKVALSEVIGLSSSATHANGIGLKKQVCQCTVFIARSKVNLARMPSEFWVMARRRYQQLVHGDQKACHARHGRG